MSKKIVPINYTSREYDSIRNDLVNYAKRYYSDVIQDFTENSFNSFIFDAVSYVGDILSFYLDTQANESFLPTALQYSNIIKLGEELGYKFADATAASQGLVALYAAIPAAADGSPDFRYNPILKKGSSFQTSDGKTFTLMEDVIMYEKNKSIVTPKRDTNGVPIQYIIKNYGKVISGSIFQKTFSIGEFTKFLKLNLETPFITEIISVFDGDGHEYFEVDYLTQNIIYRDMLNTNININDAVPVPSIMRMYTATRRFIVQRLQTTTFLVFGGSMQTTSKNYKDILVEPSTFILQKENKKFFTDKQFDPNAMVTSDKLGVGPANTSIIVTYRVNDSNNVNVSTGYLNIVSNANVEYIGENLNEQTKSDIVGTFEVENEDPIYGYVDIPDVEELKIRIKDNFSTQNRAVTVKDYESLAYSMPSKFGAVKRVRVLKDINSLRRNLNMYILSENAEGNFAQSPEILKNNLKMWLSSNKMILDTIDILDGKIINLKINYRIVGNPRFQKNEILYETKQAIINLFSRKPEFGEPLQIGDIESALRKLNQVNDIIEVNVQQQTGPLYSNVYFNVNDNLSSDERYVIIPENAVYELKYSDLDINGVIV